MEKLPKIIRGQLMMLAIQFLFGMVVNLWGILPKEESRQNQAPAFAKVAFASHGLLALAILITSAVILFKVMKRNDAQVKKLNMLSFLAIVVTFTAGILTVLLGGNASEVSSFLMAVGFLVSMAFYGRLYSLVQK